MGHVLSFTHCKDAPSTASSTPDSCPADEVHTPDSAQPSPTDQCDPDDCTAVTLADLWPLSSPQDPTFSYITIGSSVPLPRATTRTRRGRAPPSRGQLLRKEEPEEDMVSFVLLEKACHITPALPQLRSYEEERTQVEMSEQPWVLPAVVTDLLYWKDIALSATCLTGITVCLLCLIQFSVISVVSYACLILLSGTLMMRAYAKLITTMKKADDANPFQKYLDMEPLLPAPQVEVVASRLVLLFLSAMSTLRNLFLVKEAKESLKFLVLLYLLTYVGAVVNGLTLLVLGVIGLFTFPVMYKHNQALVDRYVSMVTSRISAFRAKFRAQLRKQGTKKD
ncbi:reticulon-2 isoform X2 [Hyperolius riggenbachi]|uniref:reticulon-2 isoform X2 n=1 Tax=Hyperolius riggenbachi TaxID=752182 RepID=UPI0035A2BAC4